MKDLLSALETPSKENVIKAINSLNAKLDNAISELSDEILPTQNKVILHEDKVVSTIDNQSEFTLSVSHDSAHDSVIAFLNGVKLDSSEYNINGNLLSIIGYKGLAGTLVVEVVILKNVLSSESMSEDFITKVNEHMESNMPNKYTSDGMSYRYGLKLNNEKDGLVFVYEEM